MAELRERRGVRVDVRLQTPQVVDAAADLAGYLLGQHPERLRHSAAVAERARLLTATVTDEESPLLVAAAWLHDIGYTDTLRQTGFHPLDGALHLESLGWPALLCGLVAHHSGSRFVAEARGLEGRLDTFEFAEDPLSDALTVADQTAGPDGRPMTVRTRIDDMLRRHGPESPNALAHPRREPYLLACARRVTTRLEHAGVSAQAAGIG